MSSSQPTIVISATLPADLRAKVAAACRIIDVPPGASLSEAVPEADRALVEGVLCTLKTSIGKDQLAALPKLRVVSNYAVGFDNISVPMASEHKVLVCNTPGVLDRAVADLTIGLLICLARGMVAGDAFVRSGAWTKGAAPLTMDIAGKTLGLLGMGRIGTLVARTAKAFDMKVVYHNRRRDQAAEAEGLATYVERDALFSQSDVVSVHIPLSPETRGAVGKAELDMMKPTAYLINTARGPVVDEAALIAHLQQGKIAGAGLDVMEKEPLPADSPLCSLPNVVLQAHVGSGTVETRRAMMDLAVANLLDAMAGKQPKAMVNPDTWAAAQRRAA